MKPNNKNRFNGRYNNNRSSRNHVQNITRHTVLDSAGPAGKLRGTPLQLFEKYQQLAKDALIQNDRILSETYLQFADHYMRLQNIAIENEQANKPRMTPRVVETTSLNEEDTVPDFEVPADSSEEETDLPAMDLSVPVNEIQNNK